MTVTEFQKLRREGQAHLLLDVRTEEELAIARLQPCLHIPLHDLKERAGELEPHRETPLVIMCHHGVRSAMAASFLRQQGFEVVHNLNGGIDAYAREIDPTIPTY